MDLIASPAELRARDLRLLAKIGLATVLAWWISELLGADRPAFAAIVPLVALRADDPYGVLGVSVFRILGTVAGIAIGVASLAIDPTAPLWLVALTVGVSLAVGLVARAPGEAINPVTAVTAVIVIFVGEGSAPDFAWYRMWETLVGAAVTMVVAVAVWPPDPIGGLRRLLGDLRDDVAADLRDLATAPGMPLPEADRMLDERIRRSMDTGDVTRTIDRANSGLRWNPRHRGRRRELVELAVPIRQLMAVSRYSRSLLWSMVGDPDGDHVRDWSDDGRTAFQQSIGHAGRAAGDVAGGVDPSASIASADDALLRFAAHAGPNEHLAVEVRAGIRAMLRVLRPTTAARLSAILRHRYEPGATA
jgi:uncharacterized membrane protein YgaE (UPF0421/DUF939 family)